MLTFLHRRLNLREVYDGLGVDIHCGLVALTAFYESHYVCFCFSQVRPEQVGSVLVECVLAMSINDTVPVAVPGVRRCSENAFATRAGCGCLDPL